QTGNGGTLQARRQRQTRIRRYLGYIFSSLLGRVLRGALFRLSRPLIGAPCRLQGAPQPWRAPPRLCESQEKHLKDCFTRTRAFAIALALGGVPGSGNSDGSLLN